MLPHWQVNSYLVEERKRRERRKKQRRAEYHARRKNGTQVTQDKDRLFNVRMKISFKKISKKRVVVCYGY